MTPGERFDQDEVLRFGQPWHGLWRNNVIELPNSLTHARGGPADYHSCFMVMIPGQPEVATPAEDAAQGMTWLNYGIFTDLDRLRVSDGYVSWIFIDSSNVPWRADLSFSTGLMTVTLHRFGIIGGDPDNTSYSASVGFTLPVSFGTPGGPLFRIDDIDSAGRQVAILYNEAGIATAYYANRAFLLTLSGSAATFTLSLSEETPVPPVDYTSGTFPDHDARSVWIEDNGELAGVFATDAEGNPDFEFLLEGHAYKVSYGPMLRNHSWTRYVYVLGSTLIDDTFALVQGTVYTEYSGTADINEDHLFDHYLPGQVIPRLAPVSYVASSESATFTITLNGIDTEVGGEWPLKFWQFPPFTPEEVAGQGYVWSGALDNVSYIAAAPVLAGHAERERPYSSWRGVFSGGSPVFYRRTNRTYCFGFTEGFTNHALVACGPSDSVISSGWETDADIRYATAHPLTGQMVTGSAPVCWV